MRDYARLLLLSLRVSIATSMQYRWNFLLTGGLSLVWAAASIVPLSIAFWRSGPMFGWTYEGALVVIGWFMMLKGILEGSLQPSLLATVTQIREGTLDFVLLKPKDAQFLVSTSRFDIFRSVDFMSGVAVIAWAFSRMGRSPALPDVLLATVIFLSSITLLYSMSILIASSAFWVVRLDNLTYLFNSIFDFARWPASVFKGFFRIFFTYVMPLALMTTYPAEALLGRLSPRVALFSFGFSFAFAFLARQVWTKAIGHYTSASS